MNDIKEQILLNFPSSDIEIIRYDKETNYCKIICKKCKRILEYKNITNALQRKNKNKNICKYCAVIEITNDRAKNDRLEQLLQSSIYPLDYKPEEIKWSWKKKIKWKCKKCGYEFDKTPYSISYTKTGFLCPCCEANYSILNNNIIEYRMKRNFGDEYTLIESCKNERSQKILTVKHNICGNIYKVDAYHFLRELQECPKCNHKSKGEEKVRNYLKKYNFIFEEQKVIYIENKMLFLDFYLINNGKEFAIEYNGKQHYTPVEYFGGEEGFNKQRKNDLLKIEYCKNNNIELIIIPYTNEEIINDDTLAQRLNGQVS